MLKKNTLVILVAAIVVVVVAVAAFSLMGGENDQKDEPVPPAPTTFDVVDAEGRTVSVPNEIKSVGLNGRGMVIYMCMFDSDLIKYTDQGSTDFDTDRPFTFANRALTQRTDIQFNTGSNGLSTDDVERLGKSDADVIFISQEEFNNNKDLCSLLATQKPVVVVNNGDTVLWENHKLAPNIEQLFTIMGKVLKMEKRAKELVDGINAIIADQGKHIGDQGDKVVYYGGTRGQLENTFANGILFKNIDVKGVADGYTPDARGNVSIEPEKFSTLGVNVFLMQPSSANSSMNAKTGQVMLNYVYLVNNDDDPNNDIDIVTILPHASRGIILEGVLISGYVIEHAVYGTVTLDYAKQKFEEICTLLYGGDATGILDQMDAEYQKKNSSYPCEIHFMQHHKVILKDGQYLVVPVTA